MEYTKRLFQNRHITMFQFFPVSLQSQMQALVIDNKAPVCLNKFAMPKAKSLDSSDASC